MFLNTFVPLTEAPDQSEIGHVFYRLRSHDDLLPVVLVRIKEGVGYYRRADCRNFVEMSEFSDSTRRSHDAGPIIGIGFGLLCRHYGEAEVLAQIEEAGVPSDNFDQLQPKDWPVLADRVFYHLRTRSSQLKEAALQEIKEIMSRADRRALAD